MEIDTLKYHRGHLNSTLVLLRSSVIISNTYFKCLMLGQKLCHFISIL